MSVTEHFYIIGEASVYYEITIKPNFAVAIASPLLQPAQLKPVAGRAVYSHMVASSSAVPSPALCSRPQNAVTPGFYFRHIFLSNSVKKIFVYLLLQTLFFRFIYLYIVPFNHLSLYR